MYRLHLTRGECDALAWIADRYESAAVLYDGLVPTNEREWEDFPSLQERVFDLPEYVVWAFRDAVDREDSKTVPCAGGTLADKIAHLLNEIV